MINKELTDYFDSFYCIKNLQCYLGELQEKHFLTGKLYQLDSDGLSLADILRDSQNFSKALMSDLKRKKFAFRPARLKTIKVKDKERIIFQFPLIDSIVGGYIAWTMNKILEEHLSENVHSYRRGRSFWNPIKIFSHYVQNHRETIKNPHDRGLYVIRRDIKSYTDTIPVHPTSPLWGKIKNIFFSKKYDEYSFKLIQELIRPVVVEESGIHYCLLKGIPTGQPITATLYNLYAMDLDKVVESGSNILYLRYSDDILIATSDYQAIAKIEGEMNTILTNLDLKFKEKKNGNFFFNGAAKPPSPLQVDFQGVDGVDFLGCTIKFQGTVRLKSHRQKKILNIIGKRIENISQNHLNSSRDVLGQTICNHLNSFFWSKKNQMPVKSLDLLKKMVNDRSQLKEIDFQIAMLISEAITKKKGVKAFREISYRKIRSEWNLKSFVKMRNLYAPKMG